jgi:hypothetical protein
MSKDSPCGWLVSFHITEFERKFRDHRCASATGTPVIATKLLRAAESVLDRLILQCLAQARRRPTAVEIDAHFSLHP